jgi:hypothetical protein
MRRLFVAITITLAACTGPVGCNRGTPAIQSIAAPAVDPLAEAKAILANYAKGRPVTSEAESFPALAERVKQQDAAKGELLGQGLASIKANPRTARSKAAELLKRL